MDNTCALRPSDDASEKIDARFIRTKLALRQAILELAAEFDVSTLSVSAVTRYAQINRATFYAHAESPGSLLIDVLSEELDAMRKRNVARVKEHGRLSGNSARQAMEEIINHVVLREAIYSNHAKSLLSVRAVLVKHVELSVREVLEQGYSTAPVSGEMAVLILSGFIANGVIGAVEAWLMLPAPRDRVFLVSVIEHAYPIWYAGGN
ncbi:TPA: TetR/AcrR family transcriptional regulator [Pseudomonas aeruginosa]|uniref:TetR/AcrR family transcriptional regulator n=1 Tax=Pseudomonas aeruginosa TaxID=287 RepID=UPI0003B98389|nr:TetR/AcrR family transcriptional regulator [Pseudomonas aeruginosa]ERY35697.1 hypothetical protein Q067_02332 [Pseudomonas aeruginosa BL13]MBH4028548.1 TetR/AcrR family transcriptional regulator [Pseudomonas aeruginosa]MBV5530482.1 TetR/AcrR family transcriptional regulator [Pseudomonas aeruginosa]MCS8095473.1 TetR/AcrR family transcriptional regulator [Pseudomonas aeruginosa]RTS98565.1 TetR/AcrR family transcriptional regulator [Pseudomonas aeruginosa]